MKNAEMLLEEYEGVGKKLAKKWDFLVEGIEDEYIKSSTAILLENATRKMSETQSLNEGFETGDITGINRIVLPIIRRVYPHLVANEFVTVQPMLTPTAQIFYLRYRYGAGNTISSNSDATMKGTTRAGDEFLRVPAFGDFGLNPYYSSQNIVNEPFVDGSGDDIIIDGDESAGVDHTKTLKWTPVINGTLKAKLVTFTEETITYKAPGGVTATRVERRYGDVVGMVSFEGSYDTGPINVVVTGDGFSTTASDHSFDPATKVVSVKVTYNATASGNSSLALVSDWEYSLENNNLIPEVKIGVETDFVKAKERKLKTEFTQEAMQDLKALHNIDAEAEITAVISSMLTAEIDREIIADLLNGAAIREVHDYTDDAGNQTERNFLDRNQALAAKVVNVASKIHAYGKLGRGNWVITSPEIAAKLESVRGYESANEGKHEEFNMGITLSGTLQGKSLKVFVDPYFPKNKILVGYKGNSFLSTSYVYAPYQALYSTPLIYNPETLTPIRGFLTRYGKKMVVGGEYLLGVIEVKNI